MENQILDDQMLEEQSRNPFKFQILEFALIGAFGVLYLLRDISFPREAVLVLLGLIVVFSFVRIRLELKDQLITNTGVIWKVLLALNTLVILLGFVYGILQWEGASMMLIISLSSLAYPYVVYALTLHKVSIRLKLAMVLNALAVGVMVVGMIFKSEHWLYGQSILRAGLVLIPLSLIVILLMMRKRNLSKKERYHSLNYVARSFVVLILGLTYLGL